MINLSKFYRPTVIFLSSFSVVYFAVGVTAQAGWEISAPKNGTPWKADRTEAHKMPDKSFSPNAPQSLADDWTRSLPVPPGTSLGRQPDSSQKIRFESIKDVREGKGYVWIAGEGMASVNGGGSLFAGSGGMLKPALEVTIMDVPKAAWKKCLKKLRSGKPVDLFGKGVYRNMDSGQTSSYGQELGVFKLDRLNACDMAKGRLDYKTTILK